MDMIYTEATGTTCHVRGERGVVTGVNRSGLQTTANGLERRTLGAFVKLDERPAMLYVELGSKVVVCSCGRPALGLVGHHGQCDVTAGRATKHEVTAVREITRDEFDRINGLDDLRRDLGWVA